VALLYAVIGRSWTCLLSICFSMHGRTRLKTKVDRMVEILLTTWRNQDPENGGILVSFITNRGFPFIVCSFD
jgi:hypothetical protein